jgi:2-polyprenyl-3-methyl-5-hydroxy-6-metoxy-1,4-benzoquinol methylase
MSRKLPERQRTSSDDWITDFEPEPARKHWLVTRIMEWAYRDKNNPRKFNYPRWQVSSDEMRDFEMAHAHLYFINLKVAGVDLNILEGKEVLDLGCGRGGKTIYIAQQVNLKSIHGFDIPTAFDPEAAARYSEARGVTNCTFSTGYGEAMTFSDNSFDAVISDDVFEHVYDPELVFQETFRVLRPGGIAIIKFPSYKMITAHHYDSVLLLPGLQYLLPYHTWAAGLNYLRTVSKYGFDYDPLPRAVSTRYHRSIHPFLNGIDLKGVRKAVATTPFVVEKLVTVPYYIDLNRESRTVLRRSALFAYNRVFPLLGIKEIFSTHLVFVGWKPA